MITDDEVIDLVRRFLEGREPFVEAREYGGHASSGIPGIFLRWFEGFSAPDQTAIISVLWRAVAFGDALSAYLQQASFLLAYVIRKHPEVCPNELREEVDAYASNSERVSLWLADLDSETDLPEHYRFKWRFALCMWNVLCSLQSPVATSLFQIFTNGAKDPEFVRALEIAKRVRESQFARRQPGRG